mgnify:CR=1 FL=1
MLSEFAEQHNDTGCRERDDEVQHRSDGALREHELPRRAFDQHDEQQTVQRQLQQYRLSLLLSPGKRSVRYLVARACKNVQRLLIIFLFHQNIVRVIRGHGKN